MRNNPFNTPDSPIIHLYNKSRSQSQQNRIPVRNRSKSYRQFQVKAIRKAIDRQHIIQKQFNGQKQKEIKRQRQLSKYYGAEILKIRYSPLGGDKKNEYGMNRNKGDSNRNSERISTMINIQPQTNLNINSQRNMTYQSNYLIANAASKRSNSIISSANSFQRNSSQRSSGRKISFFSEIANNPIEQANDHKKSRFAQGTREKIDRVKEEYYQEINSGQKQNKKVIHYQWYA